MQRIVINSKVGSFDVSKKAFYLLLERGSEGAKKEQINIGNLSDDWKYYSCYFLKRDDPLLIEVITELGEEASTRYSQHKIIEIPDNVEWYIYQGEDGREAIHEQHRTWE